MLTKQQNANRIRCPDYIFYIVIHHTIFKGGTCKLIKHANVYLFQFSKNWYRTQSIVQRKFFPFSSQDGHQKAKTRIMFAK